jgi:transposase
MDIMVADATTACPQCQRLQAQLDAQKAQLHTLQITIAQLQATITQLQEQLAAARKDSSTSSKPPSSDIVKPPPASATGPNKRSPGGQTGHPRHQRALFPPELVQIINHPPGACPDCGHGLEPIEGTPRIVQQVEIIDIPLHIEEHRGLPGWCPACQALHYAPFPSSIEAGGLAGPRLTAVIAYLKGACHASFSTIRKFLRDVVQLTISRGQLAKIINKVSQALDTPYQELLDNLSAQDVLNVDETGHRDNGERWWTWCFRADLYTLFKIDPTRSSAVLVEVLGKEFDGVLGCDYFSAYRRYMRETGTLLQFCLAHLIRDVKFLTTLPDPEERAYGERVREALRRLFAVIHGREQLSAAALATRLAAARHDVLLCARCAVPAGQHSQNLAQRFLKHGAAYFQFITTPGVEPTNNLAEQAIRFVVIDRRVTQGTRSEKGRRWCERIWTVIATCSQQGKSVFEYLCQAVTASFHKTPVPSLLPTD